jgi:glycosyltransferase involved in cell wall biosynthesis
VIIYVHSHGVPRVRNLPTSTLAQRKQSGNLPTCCGLSANGQWAHIGLYLFNPYFALMSHPKFSVVIPVYNRPHELKELLESLVRQTHKNFEVIVVEDGSSLSSEPIVEQFRDKLSIQYIYKPNSGPGPSRNAGFQQARGDYFVVFDSDCILPEQYFAAVEEALNKLSLDAWGGPDRAHERFTTLQRAMAYTMSSVLTTGGIRGGKKRVGWFQPRSFNMGISRKVFEITGGFKFDRFAEDIELSIRMRNNGFRVGLIPEAFVYHKRRATLAEFYHQVFNFGRGRALVGKKFPGEVKFTHWFPAIFTIATCMMIVALLISMQLFVVLFAGFLLYLAVIFLHALLESKNLAVAVLSVPSVLLQFFGYGLGFLRERLRP